MIYVTSTIFNFLIFITLTLCEDSRNWVGADNENFNRNPRVCTQICADSQLDEILQQFPSMEPDYIIRMSQNKNIENYCEDLRSSLNYLYDQIGKCCLTPAQEKFRNIIDNIEELHSNTCLNSQTKANLNKFNRCLHKMMNEVDGCVPSADEESKINEKNVCETYKRMVDCYTVEASLLCGTEAAKFFKTLMVRSLRATLDVDCGSLLYIPQEITESLAVRKEKHHHGKLIEGAAYAFVLVALLIFALSLFSGMK